MEGIGKFNMLEIVKTVDFGVYLDGGKLGEILMPARYLPEKRETGDIIEAFIYRDSEDRLIATTERPYITVGSFAFLNVTAVTAIGAFLDWGLSKDLFVPFREQKHRMEKGKSYVVYAYIDEMTLRVVASSKIEKFLNKNPSEYTQGQEVDLLICDQTDLGFNVIMNQAHRGLIYKNEVFQPLQAGQVVKGYIKTIRGDGKFDVSLQKSGYKKVDDIERRIVLLLKNNNEKISVSEKSSPEIIYKIFGTSKKAFKMALGSLYKKSMIGFQSDGTIFLK